MIITWIVIIKAIVKLIEYILLIRLSVYVIQVGLVTRVKCNKNTLNIVINGVYLY